MNNKKILVVEDDPNFGSILKDYLTLNEYDIVLAKNGIEGYEKFKKENFDVLLKIPKWRCEKFINSYSLFLGNVFGLIIWNVLSLVYIVFWFKDLKIGLQEYFYFPFEVINSLLKNNIKYHEFEFSKQWIFMMSLILISVIFYYIGKIIGNKLAKNILSKKGISVKCKQ